MYAVKLLLKGVGPRGNGSWRRNGGYEKMKDATDVRLHGVTSYNSSQTNVSQYPQHTKEEQDNEEDAVPGCTEAVVWGSALRRSKRHCEPTSPCA